MATAPKSYDPAYNSLNQEQLGGANWVIAGNLNIDEANGGSLTVGGSQLSGNKVTLTPAAGSANVCLVTIQLVDANNVAVARTAIMDVWLSDAATGAGLTGTTASGAVAAGASGTDLIVRTAKKETLVQTDATGKYVLSITDSAKTTFYVACLVGATLTVSAILTTGNYG